jgi:serine protease inhibitor
MIHGQQNVHLSPYFIKHNVRVAYEGTEVQLLEFLTSALDTGGSWFYVSTTFSKWNNTHSKGNWRALACPEAVVKKRTFYVAKDFKLRSP